MELVDVVDAAVVVVAAANASYCDCFCHANKKLQNHRCHSEDYRNDYHIVDQLDMLDC